MKRTRTQSIASLALLSLLGCVGCDTLAPVNRFFGRVGDQLSGNTASRAALKMEDAYFPDERREGINNLVDRDFGKREPYTGRYKQIAGGEPDYLVRATAVRALNRSRDASAAAVFLAALNDSNDRVRLEGVKALTNLPNPAATPTLVKMLQDPAENKDVRIAAADALHHYKTIEVARTLIAQLSGRDFSLAWQAHRSLRTLTGRDLAYDESAWLNFVTGPDKPLG